LPAREPFDAGQDARTALQIAQLIEPSRKACRLAFN
jgi:hypothetical protein